MSSQKSRSEARQRRHVRVRKSLAGKSDRPRLNVFRSARHIHAQLIDDSQGVTLAAASTVAKEVADGLKYTGNLEAARKVGAEIAKRALAANISKVVFDRNGFLYHGRVKALAEAARESGLSF